MSIGIDVSMERVIFILRLQEDSVMPMILAGMLLIADDSNVFISSLLVCWDSAGIFAYLGAFTN
jgi:hypothetical protein